MPTAAKDVIDQRLNELDRKHRMQACFNIWAPALTISILLCSLLIMAIRLSGTQLGWIELPCVVLASLIPLLFIPKIWQQKGSRKSLSAELDLLCEGRGLCMAIAAQKQPERDPDWQARLRQKLEDVELPKFQWAKARHLPLVIFCLLISLLMPRFDDHNIHNHPYAPFFDDLIDQIDTLVDQGLLKPDIAEEKREELEQLKAKAQESGMNQELWQARDRIKSYMEQQTKGTARRLAEAMVAAEQLKNDQSIEQQHKLAKALANMAKQNQDLLDKLKPKNLEQMAQLAQQAMKKMELTPDQQAALNEMLKRQGLNQEQLKELLEKGAQSGKPFNQDKEALKELARSLDKELKASSQKLSKMGMDMASLLMLMQGPPGVTRGPGHVSLTQKDPTKTETGGLETLAPGARVNPDGSITLAETVRDADINDAALKEAVRAAATSFDPAAADARRSSSAPRHRGAIARYFDGQQQPKETPELNAPPKDVPPEPTEEIDFP